VRQGPWVAQAGRKAPVGAHPLAGSGREPKNFFDLPRIRHSDQSLTPKLGPTLYFTVETVLHYLRQRMYVSAVPSDVVCLLLPPEPSRNGESRNQPNLTGSNLQVERKIRLAREVEFPHTPEHSTGVTQHPGNQKPPTAFADSESEIGVGPLLACGTFDNAPMPIGGLS